MMLMEVHIAVSESFQATVRPSSVTGNSSGSESDTSAAEL
jgi:hypothetical protein